MKYFKRALSALFAVIFMLGSLALLPVSEVSAEETSEGEEFTEVVNVETYLTDIYKTPEEKLATMKLWVADTKGYGYELYVDPDSGEVATLNTKTGDIMFSNPYDIGSSAAATDTKTDILSQVIISYTDNGATKVLNSYTEAAVREQIKVLNIKNGARVEYTIGREESRKLVPRWITVQSFTKFIKTPIEAAAAGGLISDFTKTQFLAFYSLQSWYAKSSQKAKDKLIKDYPICGETYVDEETGEERYYEIYVFQPDATTRELNKIEDLIKGYCEDYTFEQMDADHELTGYISDDEKYPVFKMALEYTLDENGLSVRMPCNGLRYDMSTYTLEYISILPYFGAGNSLNPGHNFYPDGSGSLFDFSDLNTKATTTIRGKIYGLDYAYHEISGATYQKAIRYPVYGTVATDTMYTYTTSGNPNPTTVSSTVQSKEEIEKTVAALRQTLVTFDEDSHERGYVAIIEQGDSLGEIATYHAGLLSEYNTMMNYFNPKPKDSYDIADSISVTSSNTWTIVSERKYTGNIKIRYRFLTDEAVGERIQAAAANEGETFTYYEASWLGMAEAYRDYLLASGKLSARLTEEDVQSDYIPLYLEVFGALETQQTIATIPMDVMTPLTTFENILTMYEQLSDKGVRNINFKMTGFANGGMRATVPANLKWESAVGGKDGFKELIEQANEINAKGEGYHIGLYPDFDFAYIQNNTMFDSTKLKTDAVKTIDNRYTSKRQYSATKQEYVSFYQLAISPSRYAKFYEKLTENYEKYQWKFMSIASLGTALNSDFDEDEPYNREDGKEYTIEAFDYLANKKGYSLMTDGGNAYTWGYIDHLIDVALDSSRYVKSSASVPFMGTVLHGYLQFAGAPLNEEGNINYAILRAIENGASLYFILSYQNTQELKKDVSLSEYYSVRYDIWVDDVIGYYTQLNDLLKDVQTKLIIDHDFLVGERVLDMDELLADIEQKLEDAAAKEEEIENNYESNQIIQIANLWRNAVNAQSTIATLREEMIEAVRASGTNYARISADITKLDEKVTALVDIVDLGIFSPEESPLSDAINDVNIQMSTLKSHAASTLKSYELAKYKYQQILQVIADMRSAITLIDSAEYLEDQELKDLMKAAIADYITECEAYLTEKGITDPAVGAADYLDPNNAAYVGTLAVNALSAVTSNAKVQPLIENYMQKYLFTVADLEAAAELTDADKGVIADDEEKEESEKVDDKYVVDDNSIVAIIYGDRDATTFDKTAYKTFLLNYNNFAVRVNYNGVAYTIPAGGYVWFYN